MEEKRGQSALGIAAFIVSLLGCGCLSLVGLILAIIDLAKNDQSKKHGLSIAAIVICVLWGLFILVFGLAGESNVSEQGTTEIASTQQNDVAMEESTTEEVITEEALTEKVTTEEIATEELTVGQENALKKALSYLDFSAFSYSGLMEQLEFEGFTHEEAVFAVDNCGADWNEQAAQKAKSYMDFSSFSREGLIEQLEFEGFTHEQAVYGAESVGY
ncbi:MAG: Ltp family lipoprotein [Lachnospiraceae bacterium]|nr:Ltp family lipoprotein [Lachnospiraceae bacterium]